MYVAETDENGRVMCVWVDEHGQRSARPFNPKRNRFNVTEVMSEESSSNTLLAAHFQMEGAVN